MAKNKAKAINHSKRFPYTSNPIPIKEKAVVNMKVRAAADTIV